MKPGTRIKRLREDKRITQRKFAKLIGVSQQSMSAIESNKYNSTRKLSEIATILGVTEDFILNGGDELPELWPAHHTHTLKKIKKINYTTLMDFDKFNSFQKILQFGDLEIMEILIEKNVNEKDIFITKIPHIDAMSGPKEVLRAGDVLYFNTNSTPVSKDIIYLKHNNNYLIRQYFSDGSERYFKSFNDDYPTFKGNDSTEIIATLSKIERNFKNPVENL